MALGVLFWLAYVWLVLQPSNERTWEFGMAPLPQVGRQSGSVVVGNLRDFRYGPDGLRSAGYLERTFAVDQLERVWFVQEPFTVQPFTGFNGVAHTYFVFDFRAQPPVAVSVEARRERGEAYDAVAGLFNRYELIYVWATEADITVRRAVLEHNPLYMYPLMIPAEAGRELFIQLADASHELESRPRFYNTLLSNCTNELARAANRVKADSVPLNTALVFPGYANQVLYELGYLPQDLPLEELNRRSYVTDLVAASYDREDFSERLRSALAER